MIRHLALVGPTASGKSSVAMAVAHALGDVEIVSGDSMQVYRGLDIGTAKPTPGERAAVAHHLVDVADPTDEWSVVEFQRAARAAIDDIERRGRRALLVGGTGLYVRAVIDALTFPPGEPAMQAALERQLDDPAALARAYRDLAERDPAAAARIDPGNARRVARALEVIRLTGRPFSSFGAGLDTFGPSVVPVSMVGVWLPRTALARRIGRRVRAMVDHGLVDEARAVQAGDGFSRTAAQAIGYREALDHLAGDASLDEVVDRIAARTRALARRQRMWFRRDPRITWVAVDDNPCLVVPAILALWAA